MDLEIFNDPLLNEFADSLLEDIDINEFRYIHLNNTPNTIVDNREEGCIKIDHDLDEKHDRSPHATLEALLKSQPTSSCVPPAPEFHSKLNVLNQVSVAHTAQRAPNLPSTLGHYRRNSLPILKQESCLMYTNCKARDGILLHAGCDAKNTRRAPHNAIEKRYRASINGRIDELRKLLIPHPTGDVKLNKSAVLRQAIERIKELEEKNSQLLSEVTALRSIHASDRLKPCTQSPDSGMSSLEPSSSSSSSYSGLDGDCLTPPSFGINGSTIFRSSSVNRNLYTAYDMSASMNDLCQHPMMDNLHLAGPATTLSAQTAPTCCMEPHMEDMSKLIVEPGSFGTIESSIPDETIQMSLTRSKRRAPIIHSNPSKVRRQLSALPLSACSHQTHLSSDHTLCHPAAMLITQTRPQDIPGGPHSSSTFSLVPPTSKSDTNSSVEQPSIRTNNYISPTTSSTQSGPAGLAARTTLCVSALCLIALDPAGWTNTVTEPTVSHSSGSRRLLSVFNTYGQSGASWFIWFAYVVQWIVALFLCFWACHNRKSVTLKNTSTCKPNDKQKESDCVEKHWKEANEAMYQASWTFAEHKLLECLCDLNAPFESTYTERFARRIFPHFQVTIGWLYLVTKITWGTLIRWLSIVRASPVSSLDSRTKYSLNKDNIRRLCITKTDIHLRLLDLYILAPDDHPWRGTCTVLGDPLKVARLVWMSMCAFFDHTLHAIRIVQANADRSDMSLVAKHGFTLILVLNKLELPSFVNRLLMRCIDLVAHTLDNRTLWSYLIHNNALRLLILNKPAFRLSSDPTGAPPTDLVEIRLQKTLQQMLTDQCFRAIVHHDDHVLSALEPNIITLQELSSLESPQYEEFDITYSLQSRTQYWADHAQTSWWSTFIRTAWLYEKQCTSSSTVEMTYLLTPSSEVTQHPQSGPLAEAVWLAYCSLDDRSTRNISTFRSLLAAQRSAILLRTFLDRVDSEHCNALDTSVVPFWLLACVLLASHWILTVIAKALLTYKRGGGDSKELMQSFNTALWVFCKSSNLCGVNECNWISKKISYFKTVRHLAMGANPVRSRFGLMHACRSLINPVIGACQSSVMSSNAQWKLAR